MNFNAVMIEQFTVGLMLTSLRILGLFLTAPMLSFKALALPYRVMLSIFIGFVSNHDKPLFSNSKPSFSF
jgi:flagellar biosynthesis protein FliR